MTLVNTETGETFDEMSAEEAELITDSISWRLDNIATAHEEVMPMIREALARRAWDALGYRSPGDYAADRFGGALTRLSAPVRQAVVLELTDAGMSTRAIAPVVGVSQKTVDRDRRSGESDDSPAPDPAEASPADDAEPQVAPAESETGPVADDDATATNAAPKGNSAPRPIVGRDGKTYSRPDPAAQARTAVAEFPDLAYYADLGQHRDVNNMAGDLRLFRERGELDMRLDNLRRSICRDRADRDGTLRPGMTAVMGDDGVYRMQARPEPAPQPTRTCPTCSGRGVIEE